MDILAIIERLKEYLAQLRAKWYWIVLSVAIFTTLFALHGNSKPTFYTAKTTFHPEAVKNVSSSDNALPAFLGGVPSGSDELTYMKGLLFSQSLNRSLVSDSVVFKGETYLLADLIYKYQPAYTSLFSYIQYLLNPKRPDIHRYSLESKIVSAGNMAIRSMHIGTTPTGFAELRYDYYDADVAGLICEQYLKQLKHYYSDQKSKKTQQTIQFLETRTDSIKRKLDSVNYVLARMQDQGRFRLFAKDEILPAELQSKQNILSQLYVSLYASQEQVRAQQQRELPVLQVIDPPMPPYLATKSNVVLHIVIGLLGGLVLGIFFVSLPLLIEDVRFLVREFVIKPILAQSQTASSSGGGSEVSASAARSADADAG